MISRREILVGAIASTGLVVARPARAQPAAWPQRAVRVIVPFPPGAVHDALTRILAEGLHARLAQGFVVENMTGAGGNIGMAAGAKAAPDGYTLVSATVGTLSINQFLYRSMPFDPERDFAPVSMLWRAPNTLFVSAEKNPARSLAEFIAWAKTRKQGVTFGSAGAGTTPHLCGELFKLRTGLEATHVPYRDSGQRLLSLVSGDLDFTIDNVANYGGLLRDGKVRALAVTAEKRWPTVPDAPTMAEAGLPDFVIMSWGALVAPRGTPRPVVDRLSEAVRDIIANPAVKERFMSVGGEAVASTPERLADYAARERLLWADLVRRSGARFD